MFILCFVNVYSKDAYSGGLHYTHIIIISLSFKNHNLLVQLCEILIEVSYIISH